MALMFTFFAFVLVFSIFEGYFRYVYDVSDGLGFLKVNQKWHERHVVFNSSFVRDRDFNVEKDRSTIRIGVLGDSLTFGAGVKNPEDRFSNLLEDMLIQKGYKVEVYNLGRSGTDTEGQIKSYEEVKKYDFDLIVWQYYLNDIQPEKNSTGAKVITSVSAPSYIKTLSNTSFFFDFLYWRFSQRYQQTFDQLKNADLAQYQDPEVLKTHQDQIKSFMEKLHKEDKKVVVIIFPFIHLLCPNYPARDAHAKISETFTQNGAEVIDLLNVLGDDKNPKDLVASKFDSHPNEKVHKIAADELAKTISKLLNQPIF